MNWLDKNRNSKANLSDMHPKQRLWLPIGLMLIVILSFLSMHAERMISGGIWKIALLLVVIGTLFFFLIPSLERAKLFWKNLRFRWKFAVVLILSIIYLAISFLDNLHKADPMDEDFFACLSLAVALFCLCLYGLMSRGLDALWFRLTKRK